MAFALGPMALAAGYRLSAYETIGSTSTEAMAQATLGDPGKLWVVAKEQTAGHGRRGRNWQTPPGNLAASLLLTQPGRGAASATLGFVAGLALECAIRSVAGTLSHRERVAAEQPGEGYWRPALAAASDCLVPDAPAPQPLTRRLRRRPLPVGEGRLALKWPNDVLLNGAKIAGILLEAVTRPGAESVVVIGIGVNVMHSPQGVPYPVTSLVENGADVSAETLFTALTEAWVEQEGIWNEGRGFAAIRDSWLAHATGIGAPIAVKIGADVFRGTFETIDDEGRLVVRADDGSSRAISAGEVHFGAAATAAL